MLDLDYPHLAPLRNLVPTLVKQAQGHEIETVVCEGEVVVDGGSVRGVEQRHPDLLAEASRRARDAVDRTGIDGLLDRGWPRLSPR